MIKCIVIIQLERQLEINREVLQHVWLVAHVVLVSAQVLLVLTLDFGIGVDNTNTKHSEEGSCDLLRIYRMFVSFQQNGLANKSMESPFEGHFFGGVGAMPCAVGAWSGKQTNKHLSDCSMNYKVSIIRFFVQSTSINHH